MSKLRNPRLIIVAMILVLMIGGSLRLWDEFGGSAEGSIKVAATQDEQPTTPVSRMTVKTKYATFTLPPDLTPNKGEEAHDPILLNQLYLKQQFSSWRIAIQITRLPTGSITDSGTYNLRISDPTRFKKEQAVIGDEKVTYFVDSSSQKFNTIAYFQKGSRLASITVSGGTTLQDEQMRQELDTIINSWQWYD